jgi:Protein of unknown function (DUF1441).
MSTTSFDESLSAQDLDSALRSLRKNPGTGVSVTFLSKVFRLSRYKVEKAIRKLRPVGQDRHGAPLYDLAEAASYLVEPNFDVTEYLERLKPDQLPEKLRESYWNAKLKQLRYEERAGKLWSSDRVIVLFSDVLQDIRTKLQILPDTIDRALGLDNKQLIKVTRIVHRLQDDVYKHIVRVAESGDTPNRLGEDEAEEREDDLEHDDEDII